MNMFSLLKKVIYHVIIWVRFIQLFLISLYNSFTGKVPQIPIFLEESILFLGYFYSKILLIIFRYFRAVDSFCKNAVITPLERPFCEGAEVLVRNSTVSYFSINLDREFFMMVDSISIQKYFCLLIRDCHTTKKRV